MITGGAEAYWLLGLLLSSVRIIPLFFMLPFFGFVLAPIRIVFAVAIAMSVTPSLTMLTQSSWNDVWTPTILVFLVLKEVMIGFLLGFVISLPFYAADMSGRLVDVVRGSVADSFSSYVREKTTPLGMFYMWIAIILFFAIDGHLMFLRALANSYEIMPVFNAQHGPEIMLSANNIISTTSQMLIVGVALAMPVIATVLLVDLGLGIVNRINPQISVYFVGLPLKSIVGVLGVLISLSILSSIIVDEFDKSIERIYQMIGYWK